MARNNLLHIEDARLFSIDFSNSRGWGKRFCVHLDPDMAADLEAEGWNIGHYENADGDILPFLKVKVRFDNFPPQIIMITSRGKTSLDEETSMAIDYADIENVDLVISPYHWTVNKNSGITAYLKAMYVTIHEDEFDLKYADIPDIR
jgi:hypothetical protein